ncbi:hypothetical protein C2S51_006801 [Perilla frutescens var. frutescens]|nr:hypothetical protein C2S51_006801 [Perilla frutescens var. frutescens]
MDGLPDELLISIVSLLSVNEAARTSVLAQRWRHYWIYNRILNFDDGSEMVRERKRFVDWVNRVVSLHSGESIDEFRVCLCLDKNSNGSDIDRWIEFALRKRVQKLELNFRQNRFGEDDELVYSFPNVSNLGIGLSLVSLSLTRVGLTQEILESFMSNCPTLEELHLENAYGLKIFRPSFRANRLLRRLALMDCMDLKIIEICSPNLVSFALSTSTSTDTVLNGVSSLTHLSLRAFVFFELLSHLQFLYEYLSRLETLTLHTTSTLLTGVLRRDPHRPRPPPKRQRILEKHECLKVLEIVGYAGIALDLDMALYVLNRAVSLEKVVIDGVATTGKDDLHLLKRNLSAAAQKYSPYRRRTTNPY